jgi:hypothetical protein
MYQVKQIGNEVVEQPRDIQFAMSVCQGGTNPETNTGPWLTGG